MQNTPPTTLPLTPSITHTSVQSMLAARPLVPQHCRGCQCLDHQTTPAIQPRPTLPTRVDELATPHPPQTRASALRVQWLAPCRRVPQPTTPHMCMHAPCSRCKAASWACITPPYPWTVFGRCNGNTHHSGSPVCCTKALPPVPAPAPLAVPARTALQACRDSRLWGAAYAARACCASGATAVMPALAAADA